MKSGDARDDIHDMLGCGARARGARYAAPGGAEHQDCRADAFNVIRREHCVVRDGIA